MTGMPWYKQDSDFVDDAELITLPEPIQARFIKLLCLAAQSNADGLIKLTMDQIAFKLHINLKELKETINILHKANPLFYSNNGNGIEIPIFRLKQVSKEAMEEKKEQNRLRQEKFRKEHKSVSNALVTEQSQSQSQSQNKESEKESEDSQSLSQEPTDDDVSLTGRKTEICSYAGIPPKYSRKIIADSEISPDEILAELARNYSRKGKVKNPGIITGMNLAADPPEKAAIEWNEMIKWHQYLPVALLQKLGITFQSQDEGSENVILVATRIYENPDQITEDPGVEAWRLVKAQLSGEMDRSSFQSYVASSSCISLDDGLFKISVADDKTKDWLESRLAITAARLLQGIMNRTVEIQFVVQEGQQI